MAYWSYTWPTSGPVAWNGSQFGAPRPNGRNHSGVDFRAANGSQALAVVDGKVIHIGNDPGGYDHYAIVQGADGNMYRYATHGPLSVKVGQQLKQGDPVGTIARAHLHFEVAQPGDPGFNSLKAGGATQWHAGKPPTTDPMKFFGAAPGTVVAAGQPVGVSGPETAADIPHSTDPFGVERMQVEKAAYAPGGPPLSPAAQAAASMAAAPPSRGPMLRQGMRGPAVRTLQQQLMGAGYGVGKTGADGVYGPRTTAAVRSFQRANSLKQDGVAGPWTMAAFDNGITTATNPPAEPGEVNPGGLGPVSPEDYGFGRFSAPGGAPPSAAAPFAPRPGSTFPPVPSPSPVPYNAVPSSQLASHDPGAGQGGRYALNWGQGAPAIAATPWRNNGDPVQAYAGGLLAGGPSRVAAAPPTPSPAATAAAANPNAGLHPWDAGYRWPHGEVTGPNNTVIHPDGTITSGSSTQVIGRTAPDASSPALAAGDWRSPNSVWTPSPGPMAGANSGYGAGLNLAAALGGVPPGPDWNAAARAYEAANPQRGQLGAGTPFFGQQMTTPTADQFSQRFGDQPQGDTFDQLGSAVTQFGGWLANGIGNGVSSAWHWLTGSPATAAPAAPSAPGGAPPMSPTSMLMRMIGPSTANAAEMPPGGAPAWNGMAPPSVAATRFGGATFNDTPASNIVIPQALQRPAVAPGGAPPMAAYRSAAGLPQSPAVSGWAASPAANGSASHTNPWGLSPFTPAGYTAPNYDPVGGGSRYAYNYDPSTGQGSYINSFGQTMNYSSY